MDVQLVKVTLVQALRLCTGRTADRGNKGIALLFHDHSTRRGWGVSVTPRPLISPRKEPVPIVQVTGWAPGPVWTGAGNLAPTGIRSSDHPAHSQSLYRLSYLAVWTSLWVHSFSKSIEFVNWMKCFRCLFTRSLLFTGQLSCFDTLLMSSIHYIWVLYVACEFDTLHMSSIRCLWVQYVAYEFDTLHMSSIHCIWVRYIVMSLIRCLWVRYIVYEFDTLLMSSICCIWVWYCCILLYTSLGPSQKRIVDVASGRSQGSFSVKAFTWWLLVTMKTQ
jgi:hypothetical protein